MSEDEYFKLLEKSDEKLEYLNGVVEGMAGASPEHCLIESSLFAAVAKKLDGSDCIAMTSNQAIFVAAKSAYYFADLSIVCGKPDWVDRRGISCLINPVVVVEVLSPSTSMKDESDKFHAYTSLKSVREYVLAYVDRCSIKLYERSSGDELWKTSIFQELDDEFELKSCGVRLKVRDVYGPRVVFEA